ncbi:beta-lactamase [Onchocerca flexuosa]|uniref:Beta-lactamase n=1 Tax=Onchocerca flexuosa TaxID=387005 RepID=A0A238BJ60_9BILA|nr:beta-lactamase [Onchocerca flexuosa]
MEQNGFLKFKLALILVLAYFTASTILQWLFILQYQLSTLPKGFYDDQFEAVAEAFRQNFEKGLEREGAHLTIIQNGKVVVNLWNGYSDSESLREWTQNTKTILFSTTKAIAALCLAIQVDRGRLSYDDLVVKYWPKYGQYGKHLTTIEDVLTHKLFHLYHALTFGWLVDGIFRRVDEKGRSIKTFLQEEIADKYGIGITVGLTKQEFKNLARITQPGLLEYARDILMDLRVITMLAIIYAQPSNSLAARIRIHSSWLLLNFVKIYFFENDTVALNDPNIIELNMPAITGISDAFNLAKLFSLAIDGTLLTNRTLKQIIQPTIVNWHLEKVFLYPFVKGRGFFFEKHPLNRNSYLFGHPGYGCQALDIDFDNKLVIAYLSNGLKTGSSKICKTYQSILRSLYRSL